MKWHLPRLSDSTPLLRRLTNVILFWGLPLFFLQLYWNGLDRDWEMVVGGAAFYSVVGSVGLALIEHLLFLALKNMK